MILFNLLQSAVMVAYLVMTTQGSRACNVSAVRIFTPDLLVCFVVFARWLFLLWCRLLVF